MLVRLPRRHSSDYLWSSSHGKRWPWREDIYASRGRDNGRITIASALIDMSQQRAGDFKDKGLSLKSRKQQHTVHQGTCV
ncbi:attractin 1 [Labeo rohita]|uniref:Attractin 1 n=1 Tax=Labeo rohita TaxID=84645 RepID=A0A498N6C4_LABRO|nr:attractin 1 [Labeo rohita]